MLIGRYNSAKVVEVLERWPVTGLVIVLQELSVFGVIDYASILDFMQYILGQKPIILPIIKQSLAVKKEV